MDRFSESGAPLGQWSN